MSGEYFDAVLTKNMVPLFNGTPKETKKWLEDNETNETDMVCVGKTMKLVSVPEYLAKGQ